MANEEAQALDTLESLLDLARAMIEEELSRPNDVTHRELVDALSTTKLCFLRLHAERQGALTRSPG